MDSRDPHNRHMPPGRSTLVPGATTSLDPSFFQECLIILSVYIFNHLSQHNIAYPPNHSRFCAAVTAELLPSSDLPQQRAILGLWRRDLSQGLEGWRIR